MSEIIHRCMRHIHIIQKADASGLMPCGIMRVIVINWNLTGSISCRYRHFSSRIIPAKQSAHNCLRPHLGRIPSLQYCIQMCICRITGYRASVKMNSDQRFPKLCCLPDKCILAFRKIDICRIHTLSHGGHRTGSVLSS